MPHHSLALEDMREIENVNRAALKSFFIFTFSEDMPSTKFD
jgi:hypothetical protein